MIIMIIIISQANTLPRIEAGNSFSFWVSVVSISILHCSCSLIVAIAVSRFDVFFLIGMQVFVDLHP